MTKSQLLKRITKIIILSSAASLSQSAFAASEIKKITIEGNKRIESSTIEHYLTMKVGDLYTESQENESVKKLYSTALFNDVNISYKDGNLLVKVDEPYFISKVEFKGNSKLGRKTLSADLLTTPGESVNKSKIEADVQKIKEIYKRSGRFNVLVEPKVELLENNRSKVVFEITESPKTKIKQIYIAGNSNYSDNELKTILLTKEARWFRFLSTNDVYDPGRIEYDKQLLKTFYNSVGFADFTVLSATAELSPGKDYFTVTFSIQEGVKYNFGDIAIDNKIPDLDESFLQKLITIKEGATFNLSAVETIAQEMSDALAKKGYPYVNIYPEVKKNDDFTADIEFIVDKASKVFIERINISGNLKTHDKVIRREIEFKEGDMFNSEAIDRTKRNLYNLNYFQNVSADIEPTDKPDKYHMNVNVSEKSTASIGFNVGYGSSGGMFGSVSFVERNLAGTGKYLSAVAQLGKSTSNYSLSITEPYFLDKKLSLGFSLFNNRDSASSGFGNADKKYDMRTKGGRISAGYDITKDLEHNINYTLARKKLTGETGVSQAIKQQEGTTTTSSLGHSFTFDKTDNRYLPKNGYITSISQEFAGLGGNIKYLKHEIDGKYYKSFFNNKLTFSLTGSAGIIQGLSKQKVRITDSFHLGDFDLRGFAPQGIGPRDGTGENKDGSGEALGGDKYYSASAEMLFSIPGIPEELDLKGALFIDCGSVFGRKRYDANPKHRLDKALRASVGFGFLWVTRMAPIRVDWGYPIKKQDYDKKQEFHIRFSANL